MTTTMAERRWRRTPVALALLALGAHGAAHADWTVKPSVTLRATYSDNPLLQSDELAEGGFIGEVAPALAVKYRSQRFQLGSSFKLHGYAYEGGRRDGLNRTQRDANLNAQGVLVRDWLYFTAQGMSGQRSTTPFGPEASDNEYISVNRSRVSTWRINPYLMHRFGDTTARLSYARDKVDMAARGIGASEGEDLLLDLSGAIGQKLAWGVNYLNQQLESEFVPDSGSEVLSTSLRYQATRSIALSAGVGYDKFDYSALGGTTEGRSWNTGIQWNPGARTSVSATIGHRYVGAVRSFQLSHRSRRTVWNISYDNQVTTSRRNFLLPQTFDTAAMLDQLFLAQISDPLQRAQAVEQYMLNAGLPAQLNDSINFFSNRFYLQKQLRASASLRGARSNATIGAFRTQRNALSSEQSDSLFLGSTSSALTSNVLQRGVNASLSYRLSSRSAVTLLLLSTKSDSLSGQADNSNQSARLSLTRRFGRSLSGSLQARRVNGSFSGIGGRTYRENAIIASLTYQK